jgi:hypothetical protein
MQNKPIAGPVGKINTTVVVKAGPRCHLLLRLHVAANTYAVGSPHNKEQALTGLGSGIYQIH